MVSKANIKDKYTDREKTTCLYKDALVTGVISIVVSGVSTIKLVKRCLTNEIGKSNPAKSLVNTAEAW
nr:hypothetical protein [uncultured Prevotella sp.]